MRRGAAPRSRPPRPSNRWSGLRPIANRKASTSSPPDVSASIEWTDGFLRLRYAERPDRVLQLSERRLGLRGGAGDRAALEKEIEQLRAEVTELKNQLKAQEEPPRRAGARIPAPPQTSPPTVDSDLRAAIPRRFLAARTFARAASALQEGLAPFRRPGHRTFKQRHAAQELNAPSPVEDHDRCSRILRSVACRTCASTRPASRLIEFTREAARISRSNARRGDGALTAFVRHTSASLTIQENADPDVQRDLLTALQRLAPEDAGWVHDIEGPDDMPAHVKAMLTGVSLTCRSRPGVCCSAPGRASI